MREKDHDGAAAIIMALPVLEHRKRQKERMHVRRKRARKRPHVNYTTTDGGPQA